MCIRYTHIFDSTHLSGALFTEASFGLWVLSLPASVSVYIRASVHPCVNPELVCALTCDPFKPESPNLDQIQIQIQNCLLVNQRAQVLPMYKNSTQQYKHTHIHKNDDKSSFMLIINARSVYTTHVQDTTQAQKSVTSNYNMIYIMT